MAEEKAKGPAGNPGQAFDRITFEPGKMGGRACIRGMRVTVGLVVSLVADGLSWDEILADYPYLEREDIRQALSYAAWLAREEVIPA
ncbi:MAG TPA: DUF433 domain-containing protein [Stellaceae bacterium]|jgi:uncharacterized protein (DUF433 family)|nr:DUF433 domain-containing protein [Stellaceae bacterium]